jgi:hypothetical protein
MFETFKSKMAFSGVTVLCIGLTLLIFTFASAYAFLSEGLEILSTQDLAQTFGATLAPLIATSIRVMYLGVMGWIGSLITIRGVTIMANTPKTEVGEAVAQPQDQQRKPQAPLKNAKDKPEKEAKPEAKKAEPELVVIPLEEIEQQNSKAPK